jgi:glutamate receptor ionotropic, NMDA 2B
MSTIPPLRFGTVPNTHTEATISKYYRDMFNYMKRYNRSEIAAGIEAIKRG